MVYLMAMLPHRITPDQAYSSILPTMAAVPGVDGVQGPPLNQGDVEAQNAPQGFLQRFFALHLTLFLYTEKALSVAVGAASVIIAVLLLTAWYVKYEHGSLSLPMVRQNASVQLS